MEACMLLTFVAEKLLVARNSNNVNRLTLPRYCLPVILRVHSNLPIAHLALLYPGR